MKTWIILLTSLVLVMPLCGQSEKYMKAVQYELQKAGKAKLNEDFQVVANNFARIAAAEKSEWTAWYYASFYNMLMNFNEQDVTRRNGYISLAISQANEGLKIKPDETELMVIRVMLYYAQMSLEPMTAMSLMPESNAMLDEAVLLDPGNPRIYLTRAEAIFNMPVEFGGGKDKARPVLLVAKEKFDNFVPANSISPVWGAERCAFLLSEADKN
jgi:hypothetical protein